MASEKKTAAAGAVARMAVYALIVLSPLLLLAFLRPATDHGFLYTAGKNLALVGFAIFAMQFVLSARLQWIERPFGLNILFHFHKAMAVVASLLVLSHPLLLILGEGDLSLVVGPDVKAPIWFGRIALLVILFHVLLASFRLVIRLNYETWRWVHNGVAVVFLPLAFLHSWQAGGDLQHPAMRALWVALFGAALAAYAWHRVLRPWRLRRTLYRVSEVRPEADGVWTITLVPPAGAARFDFAPGQFHFLTLRRGAHLPVEEHHWTISSSPTENILRSTIKNSGDFTATIGQTKPGDVATVLGPYGRFSYTFHPEERELVFIAGGIGITPLMSMLRHIRDTRPAREVTLLYASRSEKDIVFRDELAAMESDGVAGLKVAHVLSDPSEAWRGPRGRITRDVLFLHVGAEASRKAYYICAPPPLMRAVTRDLRGLGVPPARIHFEKFSL